MIYSSFDLISDGVRRFRTVGVSAVRAESHSSEASAVWLTRNHRYPTIEKLLARPSHGPKPTDAATIKS